MADETVIPNDPWPNRQEPIDGVTPVAEVSQDPNLFADDDTVFARELLSVPETEA